MWLNMGFKKCQRKIHDRQGHAEQIKQVPDVEKGPAKALLRLLPIGLVRLIEQTLRNPRPCVNSLVRFPD